MTQPNTGLLTVEQASKNWCPEARTISADGDEGVAAATVSRRAWGEAAVGATCLGDRCMLWRWHDQGERHQRPLAKVSAEWDKVSEADVGGWIGKPDDGRDWKIDEDEGYWYVPAPTLPPRGYCGKAGHPMQVDLLLAQIERLQFQLYADR